MVASIILLAIGFALELLVLYRHSKDLDELRDSYESLSGDMDHFGVTCIRLSRRIEEEQDA